MNFETDGFIPRSCEEFLVFVVSDLDTEIGRLRSDIVKAVFVSNKITAESFIPGEAVWEFKVFCVS